MSLSTSLSFTSPLSLQALSADSLGWSLLRHHRSFFHHRGSLSFAALQDLFLHFDPRRSSLITKPQFARGLTLAGLLLTAEEIEWLGRRYQDTRDETRVRYKEYCREVVDLQVDGEEKRLVGEAKGYPNGEAKPSMSISDRSSQSDGSLSPSSSSSGSSRLSSLLVRLRDHVYTSRKDPIDLFVSFDGLRKRRVTFPQFLRCLKPIGVELSDADVDVLYSRYHDDVDPRMMNYGDFLADLNEGFVPTEMHLIPTKEAKDFVPTPKTINFDERTKKVLTQEELSTFIGLVKEFGHLSYSRRILVKPSFKHYDRCSRGVVTSAQFDAVISSLFTKARSRHIAASELEIMHKVYRRNHYEGENTDGDLMEYERLCRHLSEREEELRLVSRQQGIDEKCIASVPIGGDSSASITSITVPAYVNLPSFHSTASLQSAASNIPPVSSLLDSLSLYCSQNRIYHIETMFYDFDPLKKGYVSADTMWRILKGQRIPLSEAEWKGLVEHFRCVPMFMDPETVTSAGGWVNYVDFAEEINLRQRGEI